MSQWGGADSAGRAYDRAYGPAGPIDLTAGLKRSVATFRLFRFDSTGTVDSFPLPHQDATFYRFPRGTTGVPFAGDGFSLFDPAGYLWVGRSDRYRIHQTRFAGDTIRIIERAYSPVPVTAEEREGAIGELERLKTELGPADLDYSAIPATKPALQALDRDDTGRLWVRPVVNGDSTVFDIYDSTGILIATATAAFPVRPYRRVTVRGTALVTVITDSLGVDYVLIGRIRP